MAKIKLEVNGESARATVTDGILTHGAVGVEIDVIVTGTQWDGIPYQVICISNGVAMPALPINGTATVPHERLVGGAHLYLGIDGNNQPGTLRIPTILADCGTVAPSTAKYDQEHPAPPTPDIYAQIMAAIESGRLNGKDGYSPTVGVQLIDGGHRITITDKAGMRSFDVLDGHDGDDYVLTYADKQQIADMARYDDREIKKGLSQCLKTPAEANVGQIFVVKSKNEDGSVVLEAVDYPDLTDYVKDTDYATDSKGGVIKTASGNGFELNSSGETMSRVFSLEQYSQKPDQTFISKGTLNNVLAAPSSQPALTAEEQIAGRKRLGLDKEWTLVGTLNTDNKDKGVTVDLSGCTELIVVGGGDATATVSLTSFTLLLVASVFNTSRHKVYARWADTILGFDNIVCKYSNSTGALNQIADNGLGYCAFTGTHIANLSKIGFNTPSAVTSCNIEIYAR